MWELDYKEGWVPKNWRFWTVVLEKTFESPLDWKEIQPVHPKGDQSWVFIEGTDVEAETPILWPPDATSWLIGKDPDAGKDWGQEEKEITEDEMIGWHHRLNEHGLDGLRELVMDREATKSWTQQSDWTELIWKCSLKHKVYLSYLYNVMLLLLWWANIYWPIIVVQGLYKYISFITSCHLFYWASFIAINS